MVDNSSTDGSFEKIRGYIERREDIKKKIIRLKHNLGFAGGNNIGFKARDSDSRYILLLNNDAIILQDALKTLVEYAENHDGTAGLQGVILKYGSRLIDSAGGFVNEFLTSYLLGSYREYPWILRKPVYISYADGSCSLYKTRHILDCVGEKLFIDEFFGYADDNVLGLMMWSCGYKIISVPEVVAYHVRGLTFGRRGSILSIYLGERNRLALSIISNTRYISIIPIHVLRNISTLLARERLSRSSRIGVRALADGVRLGEKLKRKGLFIDIYKAPIIKISLKDLGLFFTTRRAVEKYFENWAVKNINLLTIDQ